MSTKTPATRSLRGDAVCCLVQTVGSLSFSPNTRAMACVRLATPSGRGCSRAVWSRCRRDDQPRGDLVVAHAQ
jgi:hypothetical protein